MRINLTKKEIINSIHMQLGFSKKITENLLEDFLNILLDELIINKKVKISNFGTFTLRFKKSRNSTSTIRSSNRLNEAKLQRTSKRNSYKHGYC